MYQWLIENYQEYIFKSDHHGACCRIRASGLFLIFLEYLAMMILLLKITCPQVSCLDSQLHFLEGVTPIKDSNDYFE